VRKLVVGELAKRVSPSELKTAMAARVDLGARALAETDRFLPGGALAGFASADMGTTRANAESADGSVVVGGVGEAYRGTATTFAVSIPGNEATGVSANGSVVVGVILTGPDTQTAFIWDATHGKRLLGDLLPPGSPTLPTIQGASGIFSR